MKFVALGALFFLVAAVRCEIDLDINGSGIQAFKYSTGDAGQHSREEKIEADGSVSGSFSYVDANGDMRKTEYKAGPGGFQPTGDISVDKKTAEKAAELAALAPKAPVEEKVEVKIPASPFTLPSTPCQASTLQSMPHWLYLTPYTILMASHFPMLLLLPFTSGKSSV